MTLGIVAASGVLASAGLVNDTFEDGTVDPYTVVNVQGTTLAATNVAGSGEGASKAMRLATTDGTGHGYAKRSVPPTNDIVLRAWINVPAYWGAYPMLMGVFSDSGAVEHIRLAVTSAGNLEVRRGGAAGTILATVSGFWSGVWGSTPGEQVIELRVKIDDTNGIVQVKRGGVVVASLSGDTRNGGTSVTVDAIALGTHNNGPNQTYWDGIKFDPVVSGDWPVPSPPPGYLTTFPGPTLPSELTRRGILSTEESFDASGMDLSGAVGGGEGYLIPLSSIGLSGGSDFTVEVDFLKSSTSTMIGPWILDGSGAGVVASQYDNPSGLLTLRAAAFAYNSSFVNAAAGSVTPQRLRLRKSGNTYYSSRSIDGGATWTAESVAYTGWAGTPTQVGFGCILNSAIVTNVSYLRVF